MKRETVTVVSETVKPTEEKVTTGATEPNKVNVVKPKEDKKVGFEEVSEKGPVEFTTKVTETSYSVTTKKEPPVKEMTSAIKDYTSSVEHSQTVTHTTVKESKFDVSKIRTDTLGHFDMDGASESPKETKKFVPKLNLDLHETPEVTKEEVQPVIDEILSKGLIAAAARSPIIEKDSKTLSKDLVESEKRSYDAKVPQTERRHSCISPAISLERIAESEVETEEDTPKPRSISISLKNDEVEIASAIKKSDSIMKQMAENIEIIIKQASEEVDLSSEEHPIEEIEQQDIAGQVSVDSIIEEAVNTVEGYLEKSQQKEGDIASKKEMMYEETKKFAKDRPGLVKSLSRDSGEIVIMPKKKHARTFSVQSSPEEVEEQIYSDSESGKLPYGRIMGNILTQTWKTFEPSQIIRRIKTLIIVNKIFDEI